MSNPELTYALAIFNVAMPMLTYAVVAIYTLFPLWLVIIKLLNSIFITFTFGLVLILNSLLWGTGIYLLGIFLWKKLKQK